MKGIKSLLTILLITVCASVYAQNITVRGTVTDASNGEPVPGASVIVSGTTNGVVSDVSGNYSITAPSDGVLIFSSIGYETMQVPIRSNRTLSVELTPSSEFLDETIVVA
ncbi:MAG: carboxypeptidase-like regulatory domain-containing protein, partial [Paludibacteraceae bacterium]|nr:carboxypeptidase-like regulatory domain-containing protein [Paludibacteraceae bacterium]